MKNGVCPKCGSHEVYRHAGGQGAYEMIGLKEGLLKGYAAAPDKYACGVCGYLEYYLSPTNDIQVVRENWERVPTQ